MKPTVTFFVPFVVLLVAGSAMIAAPTQNTVRPGDPTLAKVWIQNTPLRVDINGTPTVAIASGTIVQARLIRQTWDYRVVAIADPRQAARTLTSVGNDGWEATGIQFSTPDGQLLLLKRPF